MKNITIEYFAVLRERAGVSQELLSTAAETPTQLFEELAQRHSFPVLRSVKVAINDEFSDWDTPLVNGDSVVFIPPVAGG
jgi:molybdopterin converting factor subunit 1